MVWSRRVPRLLAAIGSLALAVPLAGIGTAAAAAPQGLAKAAASSASSPDSPVDLSTPIDFGAAVAARGATVMAGDARFEVLGDGLIRMEYSPAGNFENLPTVNVLNRRFPVPHYRTQVSNGWLTIATSEAILRYRLGSGPFGPSNVSVSFRDAGQPATVSPVWQNECPYGQVCDAGAAALSGPANIETNHANYQSVAGFVAGLAQGNQAGATWTVLGAPAGQARVALRYSNYIGALGGPAPRTIELIVNGTDTGPLTLPPTTSWDDWSTVTADVSLKAGANTVGVLCAATDSCNVNVDTLSVSAPGSAAPTEPDMDYLGGYTRGFDTATYDSGYSCPAGTPTASQCTAALPEMHPGILDRAGYRLLDDSQSAVWTHDGWVQPRPAGGDVEDGYLFVYGNDYTQALEDLNKLTGPSPLLDESNFGVWYSDYYPYTTSDYENTLIPDFRANNVPLDDLSVDTDWKSPNEWDGWEWNPALFPDPQSFLAWAKSQGIHVTLNVHASIADNDPQLAATEALAGGSLADSTCYSGACKIWDWSQVGQAESYFALHQPYESAGRRLLVAGLVLRRLDRLHARAHPRRLDQPPVRDGSGEQGPARLRALPDRQLLPGSRRGIPGRPMVGPHLHARLHRRHLGYLEHAHLPGAACRRRGQHRRAVREQRHWQLPRAAAREPAGRLRPVRPMGAARHVPAGAAAAFQRGQPAALGLPGAGRLGRRQLPAAARGTRPVHLHPGRHWVNTGLPITSPLYLDYPGEAAAYANPGEYLYGPDMLVAPATTPGNVTTERVWFPPGKWTDWFTGATFQGPATQTLTVPLDRMPVFVKAGGIIPEQAPMGHVGADPSAPLTLRVYPGAAASFTLYQDAGSGTGYAKGQSSLTSINTAQSANAAASTVDIGPARGSYPGQAGTRSFDVDIVGVSRPQAVLLDGQPLAASDWTYDPATHTVATAVTGLANKASAQITEVGGTAVTQAEPAAVDLSIDPATPLSLSPGQTVTVTTTERNAGPGDASGTTVRLTAPSGWTVTPSTGASAGTIAPGSSATQSWKVQAPASSSTSPETASLQAQASYTSAGLQQQVSAAEQPPPAQAPPPAPVISQVSPATTAAGTSVTLTGPELRVQPGLQLPHPGSGRHQLGRTLRRRQAHDHQLE